MLSIYRHECVCVGYVSYSLETICYTAPIQHKAPVIQAALAFAGDEVDYSVKCAYSNWEVAICFLPESVQLIQANADDWQPDEAACRLTLSAVCWLWNGHQSQLVTCILISAESDLIASGLFFLCSYSVWGREVEAVLSFCGAGPTAQVYEPEMKCS